MDDSSLGVKVINESRHEKNFCLHMQNKGTDQLRNDRAADQCLSFAT